MVKPDMNKPQQAPGQISRGHKAFVCGWPVDHSKSPLIHGFWLDRLGLSGSYEKIAVEPDELSAFIRQLSGKGFAGGNVTIPHKETVMALVDELDPAAKAIGAVNTLWFDREKLLGGNTDWFGFAANLDQTVPGWDDEAGRKRAIVIGSGGAARGILFALARRGFGTIILANRTVDKARVLANEFEGCIEATSLETLPGEINGANLLVNTSSMGMAGAPSMPDPILDAVSTLAPDAVVNDIVYVPLQTALLSAATSAGRRPVDGLGMLLHQAVPGFEKWFGIRPQVTTALRRAVLGRHLAQTPKHAGLVILGLTGSIGMGKSTTAQMFRDEGIPVHDADAVVHELYAAKAAPLVESEFPGVVKDGAVDRSLLGSRVIGKPEAMKRLEAIIHPLVAEARENFLKECTKAGHSIAVLDIPLLFETGGDQHCDGVVVVTASAHEQRRRVLDRPGMTVEKLEAILAKQVSDAVKRQKADFLIDTGQGIEAARRRVTEILAAVREERAEHA